MGKGGKGKGAPPPPPKGGYGAPKAVAKVASPEEIEERRRLDEQRMKEKFEKAKKFEESNDGLDAEALAEERAAKEATMKKCPLCGFLCPEDGFEQHWVGHESCMLEHWLYLGSKFNVNVKTLLRRGINHILNVADHLHLKDDDTTCFHIQSFIDDLEEKRIELQEDTDWFPFTKRSFSWEDKEHWVNQHLTLEGEGDFCLRTATNWIHQVRRNSGSVLVHCSMGISRSSTVIIAYLMEYEGMTLKQAWYHVKERRSIMRPNDGLLRLLGKLEVLLHGGEPSLTPEEVDQQEKEQGKLFSIGGNFDDYSPDAEAAAEAAAEASTEASEAATGST